MYRIAPNLDLNAIVGSEIFQICLGRFDIQFHFGSKMTISVQSRATLLERGDIVGEWHETTNWTTLQFQRLLNLPVIGYSVPNERLLEIQFTGDIALQLHDDSDQFESMQISSHESGQIII